MRNVSFVLLAALLSSSAWLVAARELRSVSTRRTFQEVTARALRAAARTPQVLYHGGPLMTGPKNLYVIYYGKFTALQHDILDTFLQNVGGTSAFAVNSAYFDAAGRFVRNELHYAPAIDAYSDAYSQGKKLSSKSFDTQLVPRIIRNALSRGRFPVDPDGIYILTFSPDVSVPKSSFCAYHSSSTSIAAGTDLKYAIAADPPKKLYKSCSGNVATYKDKTSPNGDIGMDEVVDSLLHELSEVVTDPDGDAWFTADGSENADLCSFEYGAAALLPGGAHANHKFGSRFYLAQTLWDRLRSVCSPGL